MARVRLDQAGLAEALRSPQMAAALKAKAEEVAENVRGLDIKVGDRDGGPYEIPLPVEVFVDDASRNLKAVVLLAHPAGEAVQAKHGALTESAARAGLKVRGRS